jgi:hypothetical protein
VTSFQCWRWAVAVWLGLCGLASPQAAYADSSAAPGARAPRYLLAQPTGYTNVLDAFDGMELPDWSVTLGFRRSHSLADIARETIEADRQIGGKYRPVARSEQLTHALSLELAAGVFRDLMVFVRLPLVLSDKRSLSHPENAEPDASRFEPADASGMLGPAQSTSLFGHNERSATRSGVPGLDLGLAWGITNQYRTAYLPTWVIVLESRIGLGEVVRPCLASSDCSAGVNRGTIRLSLDSRWSYRYSWFEPYLGLRYAFEWASAASSRFTPRGVPDDVDTSLPRLLELTLGAALMLWEDRARFQRIALDLRGQAAHNSAGRDYSPLFDVLGASASTQLGAAAAGDPLVRFHGLTRVDAYAQLRAEVAVSAQAAQYVQFRLGVSLMHMTPHLLTGAPACESSPAGPCAEGRTNPLYRAAIDLPGQRFMMLGNLSYDLFASAAGQF